MKRVFCFLLLVIAASLAIAASRGDFESLSAAAEKKYTLSTHEGSRYAAKFSDWSSEPMLHAMDVCESHPPTNRYCDVIAVVAADGHIRRLLFAPGSSYVECVRKNLRLGAVAPGPPADSWPVQIRLIDGPMPKYKGEAFIMLFKRHAPSAEQPGRPEHGVGEKAVEAHDRALQPLIAKARATYPQAKSRFLEGLPAEDPVHHSETRLCFTLTLHL